MRMRIQLMMAGLFCSLMFVMTGWGEEASGLVAKTGYGNVVLDDGGTMRAFSLSARRTLYAPEMWRPARGDQVQVSFYVDGNKLVVSKMELVEAGPETPPADFCSPVAVEIVESGKSGVRAKIPSGHVLKFHYVKKTQKIPLGWMPIAGEKASLTFTCERGGPFGPGVFGVNYVIGTIEKVTEP